MAHLRLITIFFLGADASASTDDPIFSGTAGDSNAYWSFDGGDYFTAKNHANMTAIINACRTDQTGFWIAMTFQLPSGSKTKALCGSTYNASSRGFTIYKSSTEVLRLYQSNGSAAEIIGATTGLAELQDFIVIVSVNGSETIANARVWVNSTTADILDYNMEDTTLPSDQPFFIGAAAASGVVSASSIVENGTKIYSFAAGNEFLDNSKAAAVIAHLEARHGRSYII